jgi:hypothetical protein
VSKFLLITSFSLPNFSRIRYGIYFDIVSIPMFLTVLLTHLRFPKFQQNQFRYFILSCPQLSSPSSVSQIPAESVSEFYLVMSPTVLTLLSFPNFSRISFGILSCHVPNCPHPPQFPKFQQNQFRHFILSCPQLSSPSSVS